MKKPYFLLSLLSTIVLPLAACNPGEPGNSSSSPVSSTPSTQLPDSTSSSSSSDSSSNQELVITSVSILGPTSVNVGQSITLTAGVEGDPENRVTWTSLTPEIASVDQTGRVTGMAEGSATIQAASTVDPTKTATWTVAVSAVKNVPTKVLPYIDAEEATFDQESGIYTVDVYSTFHVLYNLDVESPIAPVGDVFYRLLPDTSGVSYESYVDVDRATGVCEVLSPLDDVVLTLQVGYPISQTEYVYGELKLQIKDANQEAIDALAEKLTAAVSAEAESATSATVSRSTKTVTTETSFDDSGDPVYTDVTETSDKTIQYDYFTDAVYTRITEPVTTNTGSNINVTNAYSGIQNEHYYNFSYTSNYGNTTVNDVYSKSAATGYEQNANLAFNYDDGSTYGLVNNAIEILTSTDYMGAPAIANTAAKRNMVVRSTDHAIGITSVFTSIDNFGTALDNSISLTLAFDGEGSLTYYAFSSVVLEDSKVINYVNETAELTYGTKTADTSFQNRIVIDNLLVSYLGVNNMFGQKNDQYDFTDSTKYLSGYSTEQEEYEGQRYPVYTMTPNMSFALRLQGSGSVLLDDISVKVTPIEYTILANQGDESDVTPEVPLPVCTVNNLSSNIYIVANSFTNQGNSVKGKSLVTFTTSKGVTNSFIIRYTDFGEPASIRVDHSTDFGQILFGTDTARFFINATPDNPDGYNFVLKDVKDEQGQPADGALELRRPSSTIDGTAGYVIRGLKEGKYTFKIGFADYDLVTTETYTIEVLPPRTNDDIIENVLSQSWDYGSEYMGAHISFDTDASTMTITQNNGDVEYVDTLSYILTDGVLTLTGGTEVTGMTGTYIAIGQTPTTDPGAGHYEPYFGYIRTDLSIDAALDYESLTVNLVRMGYTNSESVTFTKHYANPVLKYTYSDAYVTYNEAPHYLGVEFNEDGTGVFILKDYNSREELERATFNYTYNSGTLTFTNIGEAEFTASWNETVNCSFYDYGTNAYFTFNPIANNYTFSASFNSNY